MTSAERRSYRKFLACVFLSTAITTTAPVRAQELLKAIEPGTGYSRMKQWAIEHTLVFENFTKDSLVISGGFKEAGDSTDYGVHIISKFCAGDDYAGRAYSTTLQQATPYNATGTDRTSMSEIFKKQSQYLNALAGKPSDEGHFTGDFKVRQSKLPDTIGVSVGLSSTQGNWELGLFVHDPYIMIQVLRSKEELCK